MSLPDMMEWAKEHPDRAAVRIAELERDNTALRADKERLDWLESKAFEHRNHQTGDSLGFEWTITSEPECDNNIRSAIDAARKEAQP